MHCIPQLVHVCSKLLYIYTHIYIYICVDIYLSNALYSYSTIGPCALQVTLRLWSNVRLNYDKVALFTESNVFTKSKVFNSPITKTAFCSVDKYMCVTPHMLGGHIYMCDEGTGTPY